MQRQVDPPSIYREDLFNKSERDCIVLIHKARIEGAIAGFFFGLAVGVFLTKVIF